MSDTTAYIPAAEAYICPDPDCNMLRQGPGPCRCGEPQTAPVGRILVSGLMKGLPRKFVSLRNRLPEPDCATCNDKLNCIEDAPPSYCPLGLKPTKPAA